MIKTVSIKEVGKKATRVGVASLVERIRVARLAYDPHVDEVALIEGSPKQPIKVVLKVAKLSGADLMDELCEIKALRRG